jgi:hypothetical protein
MHQLKQNMMPDFFNTIFLQSATIVILKGDIFGVSINGLLECCVQSQKVINLFVCFEESFVFDVFEFLNGRLDVFFIEQIRLALVADGVDLLEPVK